MYKIIIFLKSKNKNMKKIRVKMKMIAKKKKKKSKTFLIDLDRFHRQLVQLCTNQVIKLPNLPKMRYFKQKTVNVTLRSFLQTSKCAPDFSFRRIIMEIKPI